MARTKKTPPSERETLDLPVQASIEEPIINGPYDEPKFWWSYDKQGTAIKQPGRREASYFCPRIKLDYLSSGGNGRVRRLSVVRAGRGGSDALRARALRRRRLQIQTGR